MEEQKQTNVRTEAQRRARKVARAIVRNGESVAKAMRDAGFSKAQANKGLSEIRKRPALRKAYDKEVQRFAAESEGLPAAELRARMIRHRLMSNVVQGKDRAVGSCKLAGQDKEVAIYQSEIQQGNIILCPPPGLTRARLEAMLADDDVPAAAFDSEHPLYTPPKKLPTEADVKITPNWHEGES